MSRLQRDDVGQGKWELPLGQCETDAACEITERVRIRGSFRVKGTLLRSNFFLYVH